MRRKKAIPVFDDHLRIGVVALDLVGFDHGPIAGCGEPGQPVDPLLIMQIGPRRHDRLFWHMARCSRPSRSLVLETSYPP